MRANSGCNTKMSAALENMASANTGAAARRARACICPPERSGPLLPSAPIPGNGLLARARAISHGDEHIHSRDRARFGASKQAGLTIATAESCTGGLIAAALTGVPGASVVLECGFVTYSNESKTQMLG